MHFGSVFGLRPVLLPPAETPVFGGDFIFHALRVAAGKNTVQFSYRPAGYPWLLMLSWGILAGVCVTSIRRQLCSYPKPATAGMK